MIQWLQLPLWLMQLHLTPAACIVYALIANRHRLSISTNAQTGNWVDAQGVYCIYPRTELAAAAGLSVTTISRAMRELVSAGLIIDRRLGQGHPNRLYIIDQATAVPDPIPDIQRADQLTLDDLEEATPAAAQATPAAAQAAPVTEQAAPDLAEQATASPAAPDLARIEATAILESKHPRIPLYKKKIEKKYSARSNSQSSDNLSAIKRCLQNAYGINPDTITHDQYTTAANRTARALDVRNPVTYTAAIIAQLITTTNQPTEDDLTDFDREWLDAVRNYAARAVV